MGTELEFFDSFLHDPSVILDPDLDILSTQTVHHDPMRPQEQHQLWNDLANEGDSLLDSILTGNDLINVNDGFTNEQEINNRLCDDTDMMTDFTECKNTFDDDFGTAEEVVVDDRLKFEVALSDDGCSEDSGFDPQHIRSPHTPTPEPSLQDILTEGGLDSNPGLSGIQVMNAFSGNSSSTSEVQKKTVTKFLTGFRNGTTILLPVITTKPSGLTSLTSKPTKRRRVSDSSSDSGNSSINLDDVSSSKSPRIVKSNGKYPALILTEEERRICERENVKLPSHYPLTREEEKNLKRIRRKIRNKVSAQDSRRRKKEYMDNMEERVKQCTAEKEQLQMKIDQLESRNKTLAGQLRRLHQIIVNGGFKQSQTSTAMMVLLLSTALFLIPGFRDQHEGSKAEASQLDISQAIKMPPMPGQSRSLLQIKQEFEDAPNMEATMIQNSNKVGIINSNKNIKEEEKEMTPPTSYSTPADHDYLGVRFDYDDMAKKKKRSYIVADVPPEGYGYSSHSLLNNKKDEIKMEVDDEEEEVYFFTDEEVIISDITTTTSSDNFSSKNDPAHFHYQQDLNRRQDRKLNVSVTTAEGSGIRTVVLHVPKDIK